MRDDHDRPEAIALENHPDRPDRVDPLMAAPPSRRLSLLWVNFQELYERHLCRHSQYGINVIHLISVIGSYLALFAVAFRLLDNVWVWMAVPVLYSLLLAFNLPLRVLAVTLVFMAGFFALFFCLPSIPLWVSLLVFVLSHEIQQWSHKIYTVELDMTRFQQKYRKGLLLFLLLSLYELPILLNYLVFEGHRSFSPQTVPRVETPAAEQPSHAVVALPE